MVKIKKLTLGELATNCYIVWDEETNDAIIIDPAENAALIINFIKQNHLNVWGALLTHGHYDHIGACHNLQNAGIPIYIHELDAPKCKDNNLNLSSQFAPDNSIKTFTPNALITGDKSYFSFGSLEIVAIHSPGHSEGSCSFAICFYEDDDINKIYQKHLFSGDAIFENGGFGRFDFYDGSREKTIKTVKMLRKFVIDGFILHAGH